MTIPTRTVKARVALDGEKEYKAALSELNKGNQVLSSEMRKLQAEFKGQTESTEFLTKKGELLERQLLQQKDKVQTLREALANAAAQYGESSEKTQEWQIKLNNAEAAQYDLQEAIAENNKALAGENETMQGLGDTVGDLAEKMGFKLPDGAKKALNGMQGLSAGTVAAMGAAVGAVMALYKAVQQLHQMTLEAAANVDEILTESMTTGLSAQTIQQLKYAENIIDVSYSTITSTLTKLTKSIASADAGNTALAESFAALGVSITDTDGSLRSAESVFYDVIDALGEIDNVTERDATAMDLLGKSAQDLNPLIIQGSDALRELAAEAEATGYVLDESQLQKLGEVDDAYQELQLQIQATKQQLAEQFAPASKEVLETFANLTQKAGDALTQSGLVKGVGELVQFAAALLEPLGSLLGLAPQLTQGLQPLYTVLHGIAGVFAWIADAGNAVIGFLTGLTSAGRTKFNTALGLNAQYGMYSNLQKWDGTAAEYESWRNSSYSGNYNAQYGYDSASGRYYDKQTGNYVYGYNAAGNANWRGGMTWLAENGPEAVFLPAGSRIMNAQETRQAMGGDTFYITIDAQSVREFNDIVEIARSARVRSRMKGG